MQMNIPHIHKKGRGEPFFYTKRPSKAKSKKLLAVSSKERSYFSPQSQDLNIITLKVNSPKSSLLSQSFNI
jgi:hypothetical protein